MTFKDTHISLLQIDQTPINLRNDQPAYDFHLSAVKLDESGNNERKVSFEQGERLAKELGMPFLETSAKMKINIENVFMHLTKNVYQKMPEDEVGDDITIGGGMRRPVKSGCCS